MKIISYTGIIILGFVILSHVQKENQWTIKGEGNVDQMKIIWHSNTWPEGLSGFNIKRRIVDQQDDWLLLNSSVIIPGNTASKDLTNISNDPKEINRLIRKRKQLIYSKKLDEISEDVYLEKVKNEAFLEMKYFMFKFDYDLAPINGFGYIDKELPAADFYEYGLFLVFDKREMGPVKTFRWKYGTSNIPELTLTPTYEIDDIMQKLELTWEFSIDEFNANEVIGFNLYKRAGNESLQKVNKNPIRIASVVGYLNHTVSLQENVNFYEFRLMPISQFGSEGKGSVVMLDLNNLTQNIH